jgi:hypothetical protein
VGDRAFEAVAVSPVHLRVAYRDAVAKTTSASAGHDAPVLTIVLSLIVYRTLPTPFAAIGIVLAASGSRRTVAGYCLDGDRLLQYACTGYVGEERSWVPVRTRSVVARWIAPSTL